jgi:hypothetical protein
MALLIDLSLIAAGFASVIGVLVSLTNKVANHQKNKHARIDVTVEALPTGGPVRCLTITNSGLSHAEGVRVSVERSYDLWEVRMMNQDQDNHHQLVIFAGDIPAGRSVSRLIPISFGSKLSCDFRGVATWSDNRKKAQNAFSVSATLH